MGGETPLSLRAPSATVRCSRNRGQPTNVPPEPHAHDLRRVPAAARAEESRPHQFRLRQLHQAEGQAPRPTAVVALATRPPPSRHLFRKADRPAPQRSRCVGRGSSGCCSSSLSVGTGWHGSSGRRKRGAGPQASLHVLAFRLPGSHGSPRSVTAPILSESRGFRRRIPPIDHNRTPSDEIGRRSAILDPFRLGARCSGPRLTSEALGSSPEPSCTRSPDVFVFELNCKYSESGKRFHRDESPSRVC